MCAVCNLLTTMDPLLTTIGPPQVEFGNLHLADFRPIPGCVPFFLAPNIMPDS